MERSKSKASYSDSGRSSGFYCDLNIGYSASVRSAKSKNRLSQATDSSRKERNGKKACR